MTIEVTEKPHAILGASGWHTWGNCPGSVVLSEGLPNNSSSYAKEGTAAHAVLENCILDRKDAEFLIGEEVIVEGEVYTVDQEMADAVNSTIDIAYGYKDESGVVMSESLVPIGFLTGEEGAEGTCDVAVISGNGTILTIIDFKYGKGVPVYASEKHDLVQPGDPDSSRQIDEGGLAFCRRCRRGEAELDKGCRPNGQLAMYALGWLQQHGFMYEDVEKVRLAIVQPRIEMHDEFEMPIADLEAFADVIREAAGRVELNRQCQIEGTTLDLVPGEKQCKFCKAKAHCPALRAATSTALKIVAEPSKASEFENLSLPKQAAAVVVNEGVSNERLSEFMRAVPLIEEAIKAARAEVERRLFAGMEIQGYYLGVGRRGARQWRDEDTVKAELTKSGRMKVADATEQKLKSPTQIEKIAKDTKWWPKFLATQPIVQPDGKPSVCKEGAGNPVYKIASDVSEFANLDAPPEIVKITKVIDAKTGNGTLVEVSAGDDIVLVNPDRALLKLAKVGEPAAPLREALLASLEPSLDDLMS